MADMGFGSPIRGLQEPLVLGVFGERVSALWAAHQGSCRSLLFKAWGSACLLTYYAIIPAAKRLVELHK